jgi:hypothetical protein
MCHKGKVKPEFKPKKPEDEREFLEGAKRAKHADIAGRMAKLVESLNKEHFTWANAPKATCWMCHRGKLEFTTKCPETNPEEK